MTQTPHDDERDGERPSDPVRRQEPDLDPGLAPDPLHDVGAAGPEDEAETR